MNRTRSVCIVVSMVMLVAITVFSDDSERDRLIQAELQTMDFGERLEMEGKALEGLLPRRFQEEWDAITPAQRLALANGTVTTNTVTEEILMVLMKEVCESVPLTLPSGMVITREEFSRAEARLHQLRELAALEYIEEAVARRGVPRDWLRTRILKPSRLRSVVVVGTIEDSEDRERGGKTYHLSPCHVLNDPLNSPPYDIWSNSTFFVSSSTNVIYVGSAPLKGDRWAFEISMDKTGDWWVREAVKVDQPDILTTESE